MLSRISVPVLALIVASCGGGEQPTPDATPQGAPPEAPAVQAPARAPEVFLRGVVRLEPVPMFRSCDLEVNAGFHDSTASGGSQVVPTFRILGAKDEDGLYLLARGGYSPQREVIVREIEFASLPSQTDGCEQPAPSYTVMARGLDPAWRVTVTDVGIEFIEAGGASLQFSPAVPRDSAAGTVYDASSIAGETHSLRLSLQRTACNEGNHAYAAMRAEAVVDGRSLAGCAWYGKVP